MLIATLVMLFLSISPGNDAQTSAPSDHIIEATAHARISQTESTSQTCGNAWLEASSISNDDIQNPIMDLDNAVRACKTLSSWYSESVKYPHLTGGKSAIEVLIERCDSGRIEADICDWIRSNPDVVQSELR